MKQSIQLFILSFLTITLYSAHSQDFKMIKDSSVWNELRVEALFPGGPLENITVQNGILGDTLLGGVLMKKVYTATDSIFNFSKINAYKKYGGLKLTDSNMVFYPNYSVEFSYEVFKEGLSINDTIYDGGVDIDINGIIYVKSIDTIQLENRELKRRWIFEKVEKYVFEGEERELNRDYAFSWIEGIGNIDCPFKNPFDCAFRTVPENTLLCFYVGDSKIYSNPNYNDCFFGIVVDNDKKSLLREVKIWPNPFSNTINIADTHNTNIEFKLIIYNQIGQIVYENLKMNSAFNANLSNLAPGVYFAKFSYDNVSISKILIKKDF